MVPPPPSNSEPGMNDTPASSSSHKDAQDGANLTSSANNNNEANANHEANPDTTTNSPKAGSPANSGAVAATTVVAVEEAQALNDVNNGNDASASNSGAVEGGASSSSNPTVSVQETIIVPASTATSTQGAESIAELLAKLTAVRGEMEQVFSAMSPVEAATHAGQLSELAGVFESCVAAFPKRSIVDAVDGAKEQLSVSASKAEIVLPPETYLDTLPVGPIENLIRFFSARPRNEDWPKHISSYDAESLYLHEGQLGQSFRNKFTNIELITGSTAPKSGEIYLSTRTPCSRTNQVLERCGKHIKKLAYVGDRDEDSPPHMTAWIEPYSLHCSNLVHLTLNRVHVRYFEDILKARATGTKKLESLSLDIYTSSRPHLYIVGRYCEGLKKLSLSTGLSAPELLWEKLGPTLEELKITPSSKPFTPRSILKNVQEHCTNLTRFVVNKHFSQIDDMASLLKSLGDKLIFAKADFSHLSFNQVQEIGNACPNAHFELSGVGVLKLDVIMGLGYRVETLNFNKRIIDMVVPNNFFEELTRLKSISLSMIEGDIGWFLSSLLDKPKPALREINITNMQDNPAEILELIATRMTALRKLKLWSRELPVAGLERLVQSNKDLSKITLKSRPAPMDTVRQVLSVLSRCAHLKELRIGRISLPTPPPPPRSSAPDTVGYSTAHEIARTADACMPYRRRNTFVQILDVDYVC